MTFRQALMADFIFPPPVGWLVAGIGALTLIHVCTGGTRRHLRRRFGSSRRLWPFEFLGAMIGVLGLLLGVGVAIDSRPIVYAGLMLMLILIIVGRVVIRRFPE